ncbi:LADA_0F03026g1_1 [Lachancea dasiensis]|uniref:LADA_0F03026g1_1 n=1 Tax=Lachancea dasiensis TaxID=1072105 RepID=A0A1G4JIN4_9SACH|nr:LADA_0F03026g1_1 [Lachancea dasiensis]
MTSIEEYSIFGLKRMLDEDMDRMAGRKESKSRLVRALGMKVASGLSLTPSLSSVKSQVRSPRSPASSLWSGSSFEAELGSYDGYSSGGSLCGSRQSSMGSHLRSFRMSGSSLTDEIEDEWAEPASSMLCGPSKTGPGAHGAAVAQPVEHHPLCDQQPAGTRMALSTEPTLRLVNMQDLDLGDEYLVSDVVQFYSPVFQRAKASSPTVTTTPPRRASVDLTIDPHSNVGTAAAAPVNNRRRSSLIIEPDVVELENWPTQHPGELYLRPPPLPAQQATASSGFASPSTALSPATPTPNRRLRQQTFNPNFLKLYAMETSSKASDLIPDLNVDEQVLRRLTFQDIWNLDIPFSPQTANVSVRDIKIALITRKKLWSEMMCEPRLDLHGDRAPWNLKFEVEQSTSKGQSAASTTRSLVRVNSELKPWMSVTSERMLRPVGKLQLTRARPGKETREIQYVVKGWCDSRFTGQ